MVNRVRPLRKARGFSQITLAEKSDVARAIVMRVDANPHAKIPLDTAVKLAGALGVRPEDLLATA